MPGRDPLPALIRLRRMAVDDAQRALGDCLREEADAAAACAAVADAMVREQAVASALDGDLVVEEFARWLRTARTQEAAAAARLARAAAETARARAALAACRGAVRVAEELQARRQAALDAEAARREQLAADEQAATRTKPPPDATHEPH